MSQMVYRETEKIQDGVQYDRQIYLVWKKHLNLYSVILTQIQNNWYCINSIIVKYSTCHAQGRIQNKDRLNYALYLISVDVNWRSKTDIPSNSMLKRTVSNSISTTKETCFCSKANHMYTYSKGFSFFLSIFYYLQFIFQ